MAELEAAVAAGPAVFNVFGAAPAAAARGPPPALPPHLRNPTDASSPRGGSPSCGSLDSSGSSADGSPRRVAHKRGSRRRTPLAPSSVASTASAASAPSGSPEPAPTTVQAAAPAGDATPLARSLDEWTQLYAGGLDAASATLRAADASGASAPAPDEGEDSETYEDDWESESDDGDGGGARSATPVAEEVDVLSATLEAMTECLARSGGLDETHRRE